MGFVFEKGAFEGFEGQVTNIDCTGSPGIVLHLNLGRGSRASGNGLQKKRCPVTTKLSADQLSTCAAACHGATAPEGFNSEVWGGSATIFGGEVPATLNKGGTLFFWKEGATEADIPDGYEGEYLKDGILVIRPQGSDEVVEVLNDSNDASPHSLVPPLDHPGDAPQGNLNPVDLGLDDD